MGFLEGCHAGLNGFSWDFIEFNGFSWVLDDFNGSFMGFHGIFVGCNGAQVDMNWVRLKWNIYSGICLDITICEIGTDLESSPFSKGKSFCRYHVSWGACHQFKNDFTD